MSKPQITIRLPSSLLAELNYYVERTGESKTDVVVNAVAEYLGSAKTLSLTQRVAKLEIQIKELTAFVKPEIYSQEGNC